jgi:hypothetical protein
MQQGEIVIYKTEEETNFQLEVRVEDETVWLTQAQMAELFQTSRNNITLHLSNVFKENELQKKSVCKESLLTAKDGKKYKTNLYNLDVIISVGYRVKSKRGTQFRIWANKILKDFLLKGYAISHRFEKIEGDIWNLKHKVGLIDFHINTNLPPSEGIFYDGQIFDAYRFVSEIIKSATESIVLIDNYIDESVLTLFSKQKPNVNTTFFTSKITKQLQLDLKKYNAQYPKIEVKQFTKAHDRFLIIDQKVVFHIGASLKDLGKRWFAFSKLQIDAKEIISKLVTDK